MLGRLLFSVAFPERVLSLFVVLVIGAAAFAAMGLGITALVRSAEGSSAVINCIYLPMAIISGTFFSPNAYPEFLRVDRRDPAADPLHELTRNVMVRNEHIWSDAGAVSWSWSGARSGLSARSGASAGSRRRVSEARIRGGPR